MSYPLISSHRDLVWAWFKHVYNFFNENEWRSNLKSNWKNTRNELPKRGVHLNYILSNRCNVAGLMFLIKESLSLIIRRMSFNSNANSLFSLVNTLKLPKHGEWLQSNKWLLTALHLDLTFFLVNGEISICSPVLTLRCLTHSP